MVHLLREIALGSANDGQLFHTERRKTLNVSEDQLKTSHRFYDCLYWDLFMAIPFITACIAIVKSSTLWMIIYIATSVLIFAIVVFKFFCTHCPHYVQSQNTLKCMFVRWVPRYFEPKPGPYDLLEKAVVAAVLLIWVAFPLYWLYLDRGLLAIYIVSLIVLIATIRRYECGRCIHFHCPTNTVPEDVRKRFLEVYPHQTNGLS